jgi:hypothetical protein
MGEQTTECLIFIYSLLLELMWDKNDNLEPGASGSHL